MSPKIRDQGTINLREDAHGPARIPVPADRRPPDSPRPGSTGRAVRQACSLQCLPCAAQRQSDLPARRAPGLLHESAHHHHHPPTWRDDVERPRDAVPAAQADLPQRAGQMPDMPAPRHVQARPWRSAGPFSTAAPACRRAARPAPCPPSRSGSRHARS